MIRGTHPNEGEPMKVDSVADNPWLAREPQPLSQPYRTIEDIRAVHPNEWVLVVGPKVDRSNNVEGGHVAFHSTLRGDLAVAVARQPRGIRVALVFTGRKMAGDEIVGYATQEGLSKRVVAPDENRRPGDPYRTMAEIKATYPGESVLLDQPKSSRNGSLQGGHVLFHSADPEEMTEVILRLPRPWDIGTYYIDGPGDDEEVFL